MHQTEFKDIKLLCSLKRLKYVLLSQTQVDQEDCSLEKLAKNLSQNGGRYSFNDVEQWKNLIDINTK